MTNCCIIKLTDNFHIIRIHFTYEIHTRKKKKNQNNTKIQFKFILFYYSKLFNDKLAPIGLPK